MARTALPLSPFLAEGFVPAAPAPTNSGSGGTILAGTYQVMVSLIRADGTETLASAPGSTTTSGTTSTITIPSPASIVGPVAPQFLPYTGWYAYVTQLGGQTFTRQQTAGQPTALGTSLVITAPPTSSGANPPQTDPAGTTIDQANGMVVNLTTETIPPAYDAHRGVLLRVKNTAASPFNAIVRAGVYPPAMRTFLGDLVVSVPSNATMWIGPLDQGRHAVQDTTVSPTATEINVDFQSGFTGTITAFVVPRNV